MHPKYPYRIKENSWLARIAAFKLGVPRVAIVMGHTIHLYHCSETEFLSNESWLKHELCHIRQFEQYGFLPFIWKYILESLRKGYRMNRFEVEAREAEKL